MKKPKVILVSGHLRRGKDTFTNLLVTHCIKNHVRVLAHSFANELKVDLHPLIGDMGINVFDPTDQQKKIIRPILIAYGCAWRELDVDHWVKLVERDIRHSDTEIIHIISDTRFLSEAEYFFNKYGRENVILVEVQRENGPTPPQEELDNQPKLTEIADHIVNWPTVGDDKLDELNKYVEEFYNKYIK